MGALFLLKWIKYKSHENSSRRKAPVNAAERSHFHYGGKIENNCIVIGFIYLYRALSHVETQFQRPRPNCQGHTFHWCQYQWRINWPNTRNRYDNGHFAKRENTGEKSMYTVGAQHSLNHRWPQLMMLWDRTGSGEEKIHVGRHTGVLEQTAVEKSTTIHRYSGLPNLMEFLATHDCKMAVSISPKRREISNQGFRAPWDLQRYRATNSDLIQKMAVINRKIFHDNVETSK